MNPAILPTLIDTVADIVLVLKTAYTDINKERNKRIDLKYIAQGTDKFSLFCTTWYTLAKKSGYNNLALIDIFTDILYPDIIDRISWDTSTPETIAEYINITTIHDSKLRVVKGEDYTKKGTKKKLINP